MYKRSFIIFLVVVDITLIIFNPLTISFYIDKLNSLINSERFNLLYSEDASITSDGDLVSDNEIKGLEDSGIDGQKYNFDTTYYPYFGMLNDNQKKVYKQIYANALSYSTTFVPVEKIDIKEIKEVFESIYNDHPELFWINTSYSYKYTSDDKCVQIILSFNETVDDIEYHKKLFNDEANKIINEANKYSTNCAKEKYVHDTIVKNVKYDKKANMNQSAYSALVNKKTICAGYSRAFQYIMIQLHIPTYYCVGISNVNHAWNIVKLDDGYYNVDLTWDTSDITRYKYFNKTDSDFTSSHKRTGLSLNLPKCNAYKYRNVTTSTTRTTSTSNSNILSNKTTSNNVTSNTTQEIIVNSNENEEQPESNEKEEQPESNVNIESIDNSINDDLNSNMTNIRRKGYERGTN